MSEDLLKPVCYQVHPFDYGVGVEGAYARTSDLALVESWRRKGWEVQELVTKDQAINYATYMTIDALGQAAQMVVDTLEQLR